MKDGMHWTVEFTVSRNWVADGFELTAEKAKEMIEEALPYAHTEETAVKIIAAPDADEIAQVQGYEDAADMAARESTI